MSNSGFNGKTPAILGVCTEIFTDSLIREREIKRLREAIDQSLDERDEQLFLTLTEQLRKEEGREPFQQVQHDILGAEDENDQS